MWQLNAAAISIEKLLDNILKEIKNENSEKIQFSFNGKCENISYNMSYLTTICHPLIIIRMLQHRLFVPFTRRNNVNPTRATAASTVTSNSLSIFSHNNKSNIFAIIIIIYILFYPIFFIKLVEAGSFRYITNLFITQIAKIIVFASIWLLASII